MYRPERPPLQDLPDDIRQMLYEGSAIEDIIFENAYELALAVDNVLTQHGAREFLGEYTYSLLRDGTRLILMLVREHDGDPSPLPDKYLAKP